MQPPGSEMCGFSEPIAQRLMRFRRAKLAFCASCLSRYFSVAERQYFRTFSTHKSAAGNGPVKFLARILKKSVHFFSQDFRRESANYSRERNRVKAAFFRRESQILSQVGAYENDLKSAA